MLRFVQDGAALKQALKFCEAHAMIVLRGCFLSSLNGDVSLWRSKARHDLRAFLRASRIVKDPAIYEDLVVYSFSSRPKYFLKNFGCIASMLLTYF